MSACKPRSIAATASSTSCKFHLVGSLTYTDIQIAVVRRYTANSKMRTSLPTPVPLLDHSDSSDVPPGPQQRVRSPAARFSLAVSGLLKLPHTRKQARQASATKKPRLMWR